MSELASILRLLFDSFNKIERNENKKREEAIQTFVSNYNSVIRAAETLSELAFRAQQSIASRRISYEDTISLNYFRNINTMMRHGTVRVIKSYEAKNFKEYDHITSAVYIFQRKGSEKTYAQEIIDAVESCRETDSFNKAQAKVEGISKEIQTAMSLAASTFGAWQAQYANIVG